MATTSEQDRIEEVPRLGFGLDEITLPIPQKEECTGLEADSEFRRFCDDVYATLHSQIQGYPDVCALMRHYYEDTGRDPLEMAQKFGFLSFRDFLMSEEMTPYVLTKVTSEGETTFHAAHLPTFEHIRTEQLVSLNNYFQKRARRQGFCDQRRVLPRLFEVTNIRNTFYNAEAARVPDVLGRPSTQSSSTQQHSIWSEDEDEENAIKPPTSPDVDSVFDSDNFAENFPITCAEASKAKKRVKFALMNTNIEEPYSENGGGSRRTTSIGNLMDIIGDLHVSDSLVEDEDEWTRMIYANAGNSSTNNITGEVDWEGEEINLKNSLAEDICPLVDLAEDGDDDPIFHSTLGKKLLQQQREQCSHPHPTKFFYFSMPSPVTPSMGNSLQSLTAPEIPWVLDEEHRHTSLSDEVFF